MDAAGDVTRNAADRHAARRRPTPASAVRTRFTELDGIRGFAALAVVSFHLRDFILRLDPPNVIAQLVGGSYLMVDLFFVLSGFVLSRKMLATSTAADVAHFAMMRVRRFAPLHLTAWSLSLLLVAATLVMQQLGVHHAPHRPAFSGHSDGPWAWVSGMFLLHGFVGPEFAGYPAAWSLSVELYLNLLLVCAIAMIRPARPKWLVGPAAVLGGAVLLLLSARGHPNTVGFVGAGRGLYGLGLGMIVHQLYLGIVHRLQRTHGEASTGGSRRAAGVLACAALTVMAWSMYRSDLVKHGHFLGIGLIAGLTVLSLALPSGGPAHRLFNSRAAQWLGTRSFALYALHGPALVGVEFCVRYLGYHQRDQRIAALIIVATLGGALIGADLGHRLVERVWEDRAAGRRTRTVRRIDLRAAPDNPTVNLPPVAVDAAGRPFRYQQRRADDDRSRSS